MKKHCLHLPQLWKLPEFAHSLHSSFETGSNPSMVSQPPLSHLPLSAALRTSLGWLFFPWTSPVFGLPLLLFSLQAGDYLPTSQVQVFLSFLWKRILSQDGWRVSKNTLILSAGPNTRGNWASVWLMHGPPAPPLHPNHKTFFSPCGEIGGAPGVTQKLTEWCGTHWCPTKSWCLPTSPCPLDIPWGSQMVSIEDKGQPEESVLWVPMEQREELMFQGPREKGGLSNGWTIQDVLVGTVLRGFHTLQFLCI